MSKEILIRKCNKCEAVIKVFDDCNCGSECGIQCCGEKMKELIPNSVEAAVEKHIPTYEVLDGELVTRVNHVMEEDHYIEWISVVSNNEEYITYFKPGDEPVAHCKYIPGSIIYAYCNKHALWKRDVN